MRRGFVLWRVVHRDLKRNVYTIERSRRAFRGRYRVVTMQTVLDHYLSDRYIDIVTFERFWWLP